MANTTPLGDVIPELSLVRNPSDGLYYKVTPSELDLFTRSYAPPPADVPEETPPETGTNLFDYGKLYMRGSAQAVSLGGYLAKKVGFDDVGQAIENLGNDAVDYWTSALTPAMQKELAKQFVVKNDMGEYEWGDAGFTTAIAAGVESLPTTLLSFGAGAGVLKVLQTFANPAGRAALAAAARTSPAAAKKLALVDSVLGVTAFGAGEGAIAGLSTAQQVESSVAKLTPEQLQTNDRYREVYESTDEDMDPAERHNYAATVVAKEAATEAGWQSGLTTALLGAPMGAYFGKVLGRRAAHMLEATAPRRVLGAAAGEAGQEFLQSGADQLIQNRAQINAGDDTRDPWEDVLNQAVGGALSGAALGGAFGLSEKSPPAAAGSATTTAGTAVPPAAPGASAPGTPPAAPRAAPPQAVQDRLKEAAKAAVAKGADRQTVVETVARAARGGAELLPTLKVLNDLGNTAAQAGPSAAATGPAAIPGETKPTPAPGVPGAATASQPTPTSASDNVPRGTPEPFPVRIDGEDEKAYAGRAKAWLKTNIDPRPVPDPATLSKDSAAYFEGGTPVPAAKLITSKGTDDKGGRIALTRFQAAQRGEIPKREPIKVRDNRDGTYTVLDGNGTVNAMRTIGVTDIPVTITETADAPTKQPKVARGAKQTSYAGQTAVDTEFQLRELADLVPSHDAAGIPNPKYPQERQNRDRSRSASQVWIRETAGNFIPERMIEGVDVGAGAPVVDSRGIVDSGNGRALLLGEVYRQGKGQPYKDYLRANAAKFGLQPEEVDQFDQPALVRVRPDTMTEDDVIAMTREANRPQIATLSPAEQAKNDSERISDEAMALYSPDESGNVLAASNDRFISAFMREIPAAERGQLMASDGKPNKVLADRLRAAMFDKAYGDERLLNAMAEDADPEFKNVLSALTTAAPAFARARAAGADAVIPDLVSGVELVRKAKRENMTLDQLLNQGQMFDPIPAGPARMAKFLAANMRSAKRMGTALSELGAALEKQAKQAQSVDMFGGSPDSPESLLDAVNQDMTRRFVFGGAQGAMFSRKGSNPDDLAAALAAHTPGNAATGVGVADAAITNPIDPSLSPEQKLAELRRLTDENKPIVAALLEDLNALGTKSSDNEKLPENITAKASRPSIRAKKPWFDIEHIRDSYRLKSVLSRVDQLAGIPDVFKRHGFTIVKVDTEKFLRPGVWGWRMVALDLRAPNGQLLEWYAPLKSVEAYKKARGHKLFEAWRTRDLATLTPEEATEFGRALIESREGYQRAYDADVAESGEAPAAIRASLANFAASFADTGVQPSIAPSTVPGLSRDQVPPDLIQEPNAGATTSVSPDSLRATTAIASSPSASAASVAPSPQGAYPRGPRAQLYQPAPGRPVMMVQVPKGLTWKMTWARFIGTQLGLDIDAMYSRAMVAQNLLVKAADELGSKLSGLAFENPGMKKRDSLESKLKRKGMQPGEITDVSRGGFVVASPAQADEVAKYLTDRYAGIDEGWNTTPAGYTDRKLIFRAPTGVTFEVQMWSRPMWEAKFGKNGREFGEGMYDRWRKLVTTNPMTRVETIADPTLYAQLGAQMNRHYAQAIEDSVRAEPQWQALFPDPEKLRAVADQMEGRTGSSQPASSRASASESSTPVPMQSEGEQRTQPSPRVTSAADAVPSIQTTAVPAPSTRKNLRDAADQSTDMPPGESVPPGKPLFSRAPATDSPAFRAWFGRSQVVNPDGSPRVVYHGTREDVDAFSLGKRGAATGARSAKQAFFFTDDQTTADTYSEMGEGRDVLRLREQARDLERKGRLAERMGERRKMKALFDQANEISDRADQLSIDESNAGVTSGANTMPVYLKMENPLRINENGEWDQYEEGAFFDALIRAQRDGHDGVIFFNTADAADFNYAEPSTVYAVFQPTQVKSATGNQGTFDPQNPSILMRRTPGGATGQTADAVRQTLAAAIGEVQPAVHVEVVQSVADLGDNAIPGDVEGVYWPGGNRVVLVADNLRSPEHAARVFAHEVFGHLAAEQHPAFQEALQAVFRLKGIGSREVVAAWNHVARTQPGLDRTTHAKEVIARIAESGTDATWFRKLLDGVRQQLRAWGMNLNWTENDLRAFIRDAATDLRKSAYRRQYMDRHAGVARQLAGLASQQKLQDENAAQPLNDLYPSEKLDWVLELDAELAALEATGKAPRRPEQFTPEPRPEAYADTAVTDQPAPPDAEAPTMQYGQNRYAGMQFSRAAPMDPALDAIYQRVMNVPLDQLGFRDRMRHFIQKFKDQDSLAVKQGLIDSFASIEALEKGQFGAVLDASQSAYKAALATKNLPSVMAAVMLKGVPEYRDGAFQPVAGRKGFVEIFQPLTTHADGNLLNHWKLWAAANRAKRLIAEGREKLFTQADIQEALQLEQKYPFFRDVLNDWQAFNNQLLDLAEDRGIIDPEARQLFAQNDYVPFYRVLEEADQQGPGTGGGLSGAKAKIKRLSGSDAQLGDVLENMVLNTAHLIDRSFKNTAMQRIVGLADGVAMEKVPMPSLPKKYGVEQVKAALAKVGIDVGDLSDEQLQAYVTLWQRVAPKGPDIVSVYEKGKPEYYRVSDPLLLRSVAGMGYDNFADVLGIFRGSKKLLTHAITADPAFMLANFVRDTLSNWVTSSASTHPFIGAIKGFRAALAEDENLMKLMMAGGGGGGFYDSNPDDVRKLLADKVPPGQMNAFMRTIVTPRNAWRVYRKIGAATENANRLAVFKAVVGNGGSVAEAAYESRDVLNFAMQGDYAAMRWLVQTVPFMNARVQGLFRLYRGARDNPRSFAMKGMAIMAATMALLLRNNDRDEYEELREWDKDTYWHLFIGGEHYRIPKPFEVGIIFATMPERIMRWGSGRDSHQILMKQIQAAVMDTLAFNPTPQLIKPIIEQYANRSMFTGSPIVGMAERNLKPEAQFDSWTSETARELAKALPDFAPEWLRSPVRLQAAVRAYTGAMGMYVLTASDYVTRAMAGYPEEPSKSVYDLPVVGRFMRDPEPRTTKYSDQLYDMLEEANALHATINRYRREGQMQQAADLLEENRGKLAVRGRLNAIALQVRNINNQVRLVQLNRSLDGDEKAERIKALLERKNDAVRRVAPLAGAF